MKIQIAPMTLSVAQAVKLYDALDEVGQQEFIRLLSASEATQVAKQISTEHKIEQTPCVCFACLYPTG